MLAATRCQTACIRDGLQFQASCSYLPVLHSRPGRICREQSCGFEHRKETKHQLLIGRAAPEDIYDNLFNSKIFRSELVMKEFDKLVKEVMDMSSLSSKFPEFDLAGKQMYLDRMDDVGSRYEIFIRRLQLSEDPAAKEYLRFINAQMLNGGLSMSGMFEGLRGSISQYRGLVEQEETVMADPIKHAAFTQELRTMWGASALGRLDLKALKDIDPRIINKAQNDPKFYQAIKELSTDPSTATMARWMDDPNIGPLVAEFARSVIAKGL